MGIFYGPSTPGESVLALHADATNRHLICGDTCGEIHMQNIEDYCCLTTSPGSTDHTARLWTINGEETGIFGQRQERDIELLLSSRGTNDDEHNRDKSMFFLFKT